MSQILFDLQIIPSKFLPYDTWTKKNLKIFIIHKRNYKDISYINISISFLFPSFFLSNKTANDSVQCCYWIQSIVNIRSLFYLIYNANIVQYKIYKKFILCKYMFANIILYQSNRKFEEMRKENKELQIISASFL